MKRLVVMILACLGSLALLVTVRADASQTNAPQANTTQSPHQIFTYYLHRVKIEDTSPAEYLWVIDNGQPDSVAAKSLASPKLRDWVLHRPSYTQIIWAHYDFGILNKIIKDMLKRNPDAFRNVPWSTNADVDKTPDEGIADFQKFCESSHVEFSGLHSQF